MLNVLVAVDHAVSISGPHRNVVGSLNALSAREDVRLRLVCSRIDEREPYARSNRTEIRLGFDPHRPSAFWSNLKVLRQSAQGIDTIYCPTGLKSLLYLQSIRAGKRLIAGPNVTPLPIRRADSPGRTELALLCDLWLEASWAKYHHTVSHVGPAKVRRIPHALDTEAFTPAKRDLSVWTRFGIPEASLKVLFVGTDAVRLKGVPELMQAIESFKRASIGGAVDFVLVGRMSDETRQRANAFGGVHLLGFQAGDDLAKIYASADIAVVPSSWENFPFSVMEAMASGLAIVASRVGGIPEQIEDGKSGLLVDLVDDRGKYLPDAGEILARAMLELVNNRATRTSLGLMARKRVLECFSEELLGRNLMAVLQGESEAAP
jgi:glycosyltransferase involved in cell wall biosynthesis